jgi:ribosomal protein S18 acetylase RimI-like enzyme
VDLAEARGSPPADDSRLRRPTGALVGYGSWKHRRLDTPQGPAQEIVIDWFGIDQAYRRKLDPEGYRWSDRLYATVEADAVEHSESDAPFALEVHADNEGAIRFWERQGFRFEEEVFVAVEGGRPYRRMIR